MKTAELGLTARLTATGAIGLMALAGCGASSPDAPPKADSACAVAEAGGQAVAEYCEKTDENSPTLPGSPSDSAETPRFDASDFHEYVPSVKSFNWIKDTLSGSEDQSADEFIQGLEENISAMHKYGLLENASGNPDEALKAFGLFLNEAYNDSNPSIATSMIVLDKYASTVKNSIAKELSSHEEGQYLLDVSFTPPGEIDKDSIIFSEIMGRQLTEQDKANIRQKLSEPPYYVTFQPDNNSEVTRAFVAANETARLLPRDAGDGETVDLGTVEGVVYDLFRFSFVRDDGVDVKAWFVASTLGLE